MDSLEVGCAIDAGLYRIAFPNLKDGANKHGCFKQIAFADNPCID
jgi:hypothetical protein